MWKLCVGALGASMIALAHADVRECASIKDDKERLACSDRATVATAAGPAAPTKKTTEMRAAYAHALGHVLLERGLDVKVFDQERGNPSYAEYDTFPVYPRLTILGTFNAPSAYRLIVAENLLSKAKSYGFAGVRFHADRGYFDFDLSKDQLPNCDKSERVCIH